MDSRPFYAFNQIRSQFSLVKQVDITLDVNPAGTGKIKLNTILPDSLPWIGTYFDGVPVTMTVLPVLYKSVWVAQFGLIKAKASFPVKI